ncbi:MAG: hypothetical protein EOM87_03505 [Clostridia bacterium]|nr:hypothetical protein [Clostridia bacterium]
MAKKKKESEITEISSSEVSPDVVKKPINPEDSLTPAERKQYRRAVKALRRSEWLDEYWIITILALVVLALMITLTIGKAIKDKKDEVEQQQEEDTLDPLDNSDIYNIKEQMDIIL